MGRIRNLFTRKNPKVSASSLVETIVATVIIMIVFGIAMNSMLGVVKQTTENSVRTASSILPTAGEKSKEVGVNANKTLNPFCV